MITFLDCIGIHNDDIEHAFDECDSALKLAFLNDKVDDLVDTSYFEKLEWNDPTNSIIEGMFLHTADILREEYDNYLCPELFDTYINGLDSHFTLKIEDEITACKKRGYKPETIKRVIKSKLHCELEGFVDFEDFVNEVDESMINSFIDYFYNDGNEIVFYESLDEYHDLDEEYEYIHPRHNVEIRMECGKIIAV